MGSSKKETLLGVMRKSLLQVIAWACKLREFNRLKIMAIKNQGKIKTWQPIYQGA